MPASQVLGLKVWTTTTRLRFLFFLWFFFSERGTEPRALRFLGKRSTTELNPQPPGCVFLKMLFSLLQPLFFFLKIYSFIIYKYTVAVIRYIRRGHRISLQMVVSHHVVAGNWTQDLWKSSRVLLTAEPSLQPCCSLLNLLLIINIKA